MRLFAWSDLHVDYELNRRIVNEISDVDYRADTLLLAGDLSHDESLLLWTLDAVRRKFGAVGFVPGNHDLWVAPRDGGNSMEKLERLQLRCRDNGILTTSFTVKVDGSPVRIVPLLSWYREPHEGPDSLFLSKPGEDPALRGWADHHRIRWPKFEEGEYAADVLLNRNSTGGINTPAPTVVTFSHFLPRVELVFRDWEAFCERREISSHDPHPSFNFTRVAGCLSIDRTLRSLNSSVHVYGHQHRNRDREFEGVRYISRCLGYPDERTASGLPVDQFLPARIVPPR